MLDRTRRNGSYRFLSWFLCLLLVINTVQPFSLMTGFSVRAEEAGQGLIENLTLTWLTQETGYDATGPELLELNTIDVFSGEIDDGELGLSASLDFCLAQNRTYETGDIQITVPTQFGPADKKLDTLTPKKCYAKETIILRSTDCRSAASV